MRGLVAIEPRSNREVIGRAIQHLRPHIEVLIVEPEELVEEVAALGAARTSHQQSQQDRGPGSTAPALPMPSWSHNPAPLSAGTVGSGRWRLETPRTRYHDKRGYPIPSA
jgi:hypothetical protein